MKLKLNHSEFNALYLMLQRVISGSQPTGMNAIILHDLIYGIFKKFYARAIEKKKKYSITISDGQACAFYLFFSKYQIPSEDVHTANLVIRINNFIQQKFSV